jgi:tetratricopeptide (TPR) repeat protein
VKILFLAANPVNVVTRLRIDEEFREISQKVRMATLRDQVEIVFRPAVRVGDLKDALLSHQPDIVHFSGHCSPSSGIILENEDGTRKAVSREAISDLFRILKDNISVVVLNACYAKDQAEALSETIDFTIGMSDAIDDRAAIVFASHFYQSLAFGRSVKEAFDLAVVQLRLEGFDAAYAPNLMVRKGVKAWQSRIVKSSRRIALVGNQVGIEPIGGGYTDTTIDGSFRRGDDDREQAGKSRSEAFLSWLFVILTISLVTDILRRFLGNDGGWWDIGAVIAQSILIPSAILTAALIAASLMRPSHALIEKAANLSLFNERHMARRAAIFTLITLLIAFGLLLSLPVFARYYNERGIGFQYDEPPDLSQARESYQRAVRLYPRYAQAHYNLATVYEDLQPEKAVEEYLLAIRYDSRIYPAYNNLARLYLLRGKENYYESALNILSQASDLAPQDENVQYSLNKNLGWTHYALKHYAMAEIYLRRAISLRNQQGGAAAHCLLAYVLREQGKAGVTDECFDCVSFAPGEKDVEPKWVSDAQDCLMKGEGK